MRVPQAVGVFYTVVAIIVIIWALANSVEAGFGLVGLVSIAATLALAVTSPIMAYGVGRSRCVQNTYERSTK